MSYATPQSSSSSAASIVWSISFGDLLTLLVCFFLVLTPWDALNRQQNHEQLQSSRTLPLTVDLVGTNLAPSMSGQAPLVKAGGQLLRREALTEKNRSVVLKAEIPLFSFQIGEPSVSGIEDLMSSLRREAQPVLRKKSVVILRLCNRTLPIDEYVPMLGRMLREVGVSEDQIVVSYPTGSCSDVATMRPVTEQLVGSVTILEELSTHHR